MRNGIRLRSGRCIALAICLLAVTSGRLSAQATLYWDITSGIGGAGGATPSGTWDTTTFNWNTDSTGAATTTTWTAGDNAVFAAGGDATGSYTVTVSGTQTVGSITVEEGTITQGTGTVSFGAANGVFTIASGATWNNSGAGTGTITGTNGITMSASSGSTGVLRLGGLNTMTRGSGAVVQIDGGIVDFTADLGLGSAPGAPNAAAVTINGGTLRATLAGAVTLNVNRGITIGALGGTIDVVNTTNTGLSLPSAAAFTLNGAGTLTKTGPGRFTMNTTSTSFTGKYIVNAGSINVPGDGRFGLAPASPVADYFTLNGGALRAALTTASTWNANRGVTLLAGGGTLMQPGAGTTTDSLTYGGIIAGTAGGSLTIASTDAAGGGAADGIIILTATNSTYNGATTVNNGMTLNVGTFADVNMPSSIGRGSAGGTAADLTLLGGILQYTGATNQATDRLFRLGIGGGTLDASGASNATVSFTGTGDMGSTGTGTRTLTLAGTSTGNNTLAVRIIDQGANATSLVKSAAGTWILTNSNTFSGGATVSAGTLAIGDNSALGTGALALNGGGIAATGAARTITNNTTLSANSNVSGTLALTLNGTFTNSGGNRVLSSTSTALTTIAGNVFLSEAAATGRTLSIGGTGMVLLSGNIANASAAGAGVGNLTIADPGTGNLHSVTLSGDNTYSGNTTLSIRSNLNINSATALGSSKFVANATTSVTFDNTSGSAITLTNTNNIDLSGGSPTFVGTNDLSFGNNTVAMIGASRTITTTAGTLTVGAITQDATPRNFTKQGAGTLVLLGSSSYTGTTNIQLGTMRISGAADRLPTGTTVNLGQASSTNLGTLDLNGQNQTVAGLVSVAGTNATASTNTVTSATSATLTLGGGASYSYGAGTDANSGVITGSINVVKSGSGTQAFGGANTYSGGTTVSAGTLLVTNTTGSGTGSGAVDVLGTGAAGSGGTLGGTGSISGAVTVSSSTAGIQGGTLAPGTSVGKLTASGGVTFQPNGTFAVEIASTTADTSLAYASHDHLDAVAGTINMFANSVLAVDGANLPFDQFPVSPYEYRIGTAADYMNGAGAAADGFVFGTRDSDGNVNTGPTGGVIISPTNFAAPTEFSLTRQGDFLVLSFTPVPEPAAVTTIFAAGLGGAAWLRRRRAARDVASAV